MILYSDGSWDGGSGLRYSDQEGRDEIPNEESMGRIYEYADQMDKLYAEEDVSPDVSYEDLGLDEFSYDSNPIPESVDSEPEEALFNFDAEPAPMPDEPPSHQWQEIAEDISNDVGVTTGRIGTQRVSVADSGYEPSISVAQREADRLDDLRAEVNALREEAADIPEMRRRSI